MVVRCMCCSSFRFQLLELELRLHEHEYEPQFAPMLINSSANHANSAKNH